MTDHVQEQALAIIAAHQAPMGLSTLYSRCDLAETRGEVAVALNGLARDGRVDVMRCKETGRRLFGPAGSQEDPTPAPTPAPEKVNTAQLGTHKNGGDMTMGQRVAAFLEELGRAATSHEIAEALGESDRHHSVGCALSILKKTGQVAARPAGKGPNKLFTWVGEGAVSAAPNVNTPSLPKSKTPKAVKAPAGPRNPLATERSAENPGHAGAGEFSFCVWCDGRVDLYRAGKPIDCLSAEEAQQMARFLINSRPPLQAPRPSHDH